MRRSPFPFDYFRIFFPMALLLAIASIIYTFAVLMPSCHARGGILVNAPFGYQCVAAASPVHLFGPILP